MKPRTLPLHEVNLCSVVAMNRGLDPTEINHMIEAEFKDGLTPMCREIVDGLMYPKGHVKYKKPAKDVAGVIANYDQWISSMQASADDHYKTALHKLEEAEGHICAVRRKYFGDYRPRTTILREARKAIKD